VIHWKGGRAYATRDGTTTFRNETATPHGGAGDHRRMAVRYGDDQIASVLTDALFTGKGAVNQTRVATAR